MFAVWHMLSTGQTYDDLGADYPANRNSQAETRRLVKRLEALGHTSLSPRPRSNPVTPSKDAGLRPAS